MRILLTHVFTAQNKGDAGIVSGMITEFQRVFPTAEIVLSAMEEPEKNPYATQRAITISSFFYEAIYVQPDPLSRILRTLATISGTLLWAGIYRLFGHKWNLIVSAVNKKILLEYTQADMIVPVGGCYLRGNNSLQSWVTIVLQLHAILIARILDKPVYMYSQSIGPFDNPTQTAIVGLVLNHAQLIFAREDITVATLQNMGVNQGLIKRGIDAGFLLTSNNSLKHQRLLKSLNLQPKPVTGITVRDWLEASKQKKYEQTMAELADWIVAKTKGTVVFIPQVTAAEHNDDDRICANRVFMLTKNKKSIRLITDELNHFEIKYVYNSLDFFIGTRMHSSIFSLTGFVPTIAIEYEYKTRGIFRDLSLEQWVIKMEDVTFLKMKKLFEKLLKEKTKYRQYLQRRIPDYIGQVQETATLIREHYQTEWQAHL